MDKQPIPVAELLLQPFTAFEPAGILLVSGADALHANPMTIGWGMFGIMWRQPVVMVMVRHSRYTWQLITQAPDFTVNWLPAASAEALRICGTASGRAGDKFAASGLTPVAGSLVASPVLAQSVLALECRTLYRADLKPEGFLDPSVLGMYADGDLHDLFFGLVVAAAGIEAFRRK